MLPALILRSIFGKGRLMSDLIVSLGTGLSGGYTGSQWVIRMTWRNYVGEGRDRYLWRALVQAQKALQAAKGGV